MSVFVHTYKYYVYIIYIYIYTKGGAVNAEIDNFLECRSMFSKGEKSCTVQVLPSLGKATLLNLIQET